MLAGIDFGSKMAGTTVICYGKENDLLHLITSSKNQDADQMILNFVAAHHVNIIGIDAPLSLPPGVLGQDGSYFYRNCDQILGAMSPMFLGGLTARAMKLKNDIQHQKSIDIIEVYPKAVVKYILDDIFKQLYKQKDAHQLKKFVEILISSFNLELDTDVYNWHQVDAILAWLSVQRYSNSKSDQFGDEFGIIHV